MTEWQRLKLIGLLGIITSISLIVITSKILNIILWEM